MGFQIFWLTLIVIAGFCAVHYQLRIRAERKIVDYTILIHRSPPEDRPRFSDLVNDVMKLGCQPLGAPFQDANGYFRQAMVKYK